MSSEAINELSAYISLLVKAAGGEVRIPFEELEQGLPPDHGVRIVMNHDDQEAVFTFEKVSE